EWSLCPQIGCLRTHWQAGSLRSQEKSDFAILLAEYRQKNAPCFFLPVFLLGYRQDFTRIFVPPSTRKDHRPCPL
ncbi:MAG: hypothetical protein FWC43_08790, partial [Planctomycetaceae bacterium]|nr:hypothetical protein [Planctomycetaceae bacterium]